MKFETWEDIREKITPDAKFSVMEFISILKIAKFLPKELIDAKDEWIAVKLLDALHDSLDDKDVVI